MPLLRTKPKALAAATEIVEPNKVRGDPLDKDSKTVASKFMDLLAVKI